MDRLAACGLPGMVGQVAETWGGCQGRPPAFSVSLSLPRCHRMNDRGRHVVDLGEICQRLNAMASTLARELLPLGSAEGHLWRDARTSAGGQFGDSLKVNTKTGKWRWYTDTDKYGDMLDLYMLVHECTKVDAIKWARGKLGLPNGGPASPAVKRDMEASRAAAEEKRRLQEAEDAKDLEQKRAGAKAAWLGARPELLGTPAGDYLIGRGIQLERLAKLGWGLQSLRFAPSLKHPFAKAFMPAMVALAIFPDGRTASLHRTYLVKRNGVWDRMREDLDGHEGKLLYCAIDGGVIPLWRGMRLSKRGGGEVIKGYSFTDPQAGPDLTLIEGIENGLTVVQLDVDRRLATTIALSNACRLKLPSVYRRLTWVRDNDAPGSKADKLLERVLDHLEEISDETFLVSPPARVKDFNDGVKPRNNNKNAVTPSNDRSLGR